jgi:uncharacterized protein YigE (DUF2233 family)
MNPALRLLVVFVGLPMLPIIGCREQTAPSRQSNTAVIQARAQAEQWPGKAARIKYAGKTFDTYTLDYPRECIQLFWKDGEGHKLMGIESLKAFVEAQGQTLVFATNAGMFMEDFTPLGLYIEAGKTLRRLNSVESAFGNFYLQPNGIFVLTATEAVIVPTTQYQSIKEKILYATQSGPLLVINGRVHPSFTKGSQNLNIRSGVGIDTAGNVVFAISNTLTNYYDFAMLFKEQLRCDQALFLDGAISKMYLPALQRKELGGEFGVMIGVTVPK